MQSAKLETRPRLYQFLGHTNGLSRPVQYDKIINIGMAMDPQLDNQLDTPLYRQLYDNIADRIRNGEFRNGERLPATRELAGQLGLNRTTVSAAYTLLEQNGLIRGHVGRGSFVDYRPSGDQTISFASSRPAVELFPIAEFQAACREVIEGPDAANILQLGSPSGYGPLRHYLRQRGREAGEYPLTKN